MYIRDQLDAFAEAILRPINPSAAFLMGLYTVVWGFWVISPFWTVFTQAELYTVLSVIAPEVFWGGLAITCGFVTCAGAWARAYRPLVRGAVVMFLHWFLISGFYFAGDPASTGGITALFVAIYAAYIYLNLRVNFMHNKKGRHKMRKRY